MKKQCIFMGLLAMSLANAQTELEGRVGINTENPIASLNVKSKTGTTSATKNLELENANGNKLVTVLDNGNVGIGTTAPNTKLEVVSATEGSAFRMADGSQGVHKVLTSDANGNATWKFADQLKLSKVHFSGTNSFEYASYRAADKITPTIEVASKVTILGKNEIGLKTTPSSIILPAGTYLIALSHDIDDNEYARLNVRKTSNKETVMTVFYGEWLKATFDLTLDKEDGIYFEVMPFANNPKYPDPQNRLPNPSPEYYRKSYDNVAFSNIVTVVKLK